MGTVETLTVVPGGHKEANEREKKYRIKSQACDLYARGFLEPGGREQRSGKRWAGEGAAAFIPGASMGR